LDSYESLISSQEVKFQSTPPASGTGDAILFDSDHAGAEGPARRASIRHLVEFEYPLAAWDGSFI
jgi:hypothetical protein